MRLLVTGGSGFVGTQLSRRLQQLGHEIVCLQTSEMLSTGPISHIVSDIRQVKAEFLDGIECVIHLAAIAHRRGIADELIHAVNVEGTRSLVRAANTAGVPRMLLLSSVKALGESSLSPMPTDQTPAPEDSYGRSKMLAERVLLTEFDGRGSVIRVPLLYGPGTKGNFATLLKLAQSGVPLPFAGVENRRSLLGIANLLSFVCHLIEGDEHGIFHVADEESVSLTELITLLRQASGVPERLFHMPSPLLNILLRNLLGQDPRKLLGTLELETATSFVRAGWKPPHTIKEQIAASLA